jgi:CRP/FNR family transcriptional regulator
MELSEIIEFKSSPRIREKLADIGFTKTFSEGEIIVNENAYVRAIPIVTNGSIKELIYYFSLIFFITLWNT